MPLEAIILWLVVILSSVIGAGLFLRRDRRLLSLVALGVVIAVLGPVGVWIVSHNACWA